LGLSANPFYVSGDDAYAGVPFVDLDRVKKAAGELGPEERKRNEVQEIVIGLKAIAQRAPAPSKGEIGKKKKYSLFRFLNPRSASLTRRIPPTAPYRLIARLIFT
jgi:hypothetical protein